ncbi:TrpB-like pyridoxal phosphate-dependent enzyme [Streptomyces camelliae]|uniref:tryptophan synthase n=1 Tax=Streptomyces camelliae TaxID=3004093 RepID=A0ABY7P404_9ACTN|nr:TrpB-like pyridoxal phosphate-dependent enzyme [Streptomyces sp. HUAS 2-6]WBO65122.1 TrpB-like pyridoxal phosphate-dependent enzyme [Streptomyces sp. HUAS 2-6]
MSEDAVRSGVPTHWYNVIADLAGYIPQERRPAQRAGRHGVQPQLPLSIYRQSVSKESFIAIPDEVRAEYERWRPTPLVRARKLEKALGTPAKIYYKYEGVSPSGSHKLNSAIAQAYYYKKAGIRELVTGTGAGQWGTALAMACKSYGMDCTVYMVKCSYEQKPYRRLMMELNGAKVIPSPSVHTEAGRTILLEDPDCPGSLSVASSEAHEYANEGDGVRYSAGSGDNHVLLHQTVIGEEALVQMAERGEFPDTVIGAIGAGSNFAGLAFPFYRASVETGRKTRLVAVEPKSCPKLTRGVYTWDHHDALGNTPMSKMYTLGNDFMPSPIHAGGLRYHGAAPVISWMYHENLVEAVAYAQNEIFEAGVTFARAEQIIPAPESAHAIKHAIDRAVRARESGSTETILFNLSGHGLMDLGAYEKYMNGLLGDDSATELEVDQAIEKLTRARDERGHGSES